MLLALERLDTLIKDMYVCTITEITDFDTFSASFDPNKTQICGFIPVIQGYSPPQRSSYELLNYLINSICLCIYLFIESKG